MSPKPFFTTNAHNVHGKTLERLLFVKKIYLRTMAVFFFCQADLNPGTHVNANPGKPYCLMPTKHNRLWLVTYLIQ